jgi:outer membrane protein TolC
MPSAEPAPGPQLLSRAAALQWALQNNPLLTAARQQHGIAAAGIVIARQYPFNPVWQAFVWADNGPAAAGITNRVFNEHTTRLDMELRGQGRIRLAGARATLSRTDWDIATQELMVAVRVLRAFDSVVYRRDKLQLVEEIVRLQEQTADQVRLMAEKGRVRGADAILARTEVDAARAQRGPAQVALTLAKQELMRSLGTVADVFVVEGTLETAPVQPDNDALTKLALEHRPEIHSRQMAIAEAEALLKLEIANRYGNPSLGPAFEYNETSVYFMGGWLFTPLPLINTRRGEIMQRKATRERAVFDLRQTEVAVQQDVQAAEARLKHAEDWVKMYRTDVLPNLKRSLADMEKLYTQGEPNVDLLRVNDIRRRLLTSYDVYLDAQFELRQAHSDMAAAVGDPALALQP